MTSIVKQGSSLGLCPTFLSPNLHYNWPSGHLTLCQVLSGRRQRQILLTVLICCWLWPQLALSTQANLRSKCPWFWLGHLWVGELYHWHLCIALDLAVQFKLWSRICAWTHVWVSQIGKFKWVHNDQHRKAKM